MIHAKDSESGCRFLNTTLPGLAPVNFYILEDGTSVNPRPVTEAGSDGAWNRLGVRTSEVVGCKCVPVSQPDIVLVEWPRGSLKDNLVPRISPLRAIRLVDGSEIVACE